jgi:hypothetical protein
MCDSDEHAGQTKFIICFSEQSQLPVIHHQTPLPNEAMACSRLLVFGECNNPEHPHPFTRYMRVMTQNCNRPWSTWGPLVTPSRARYFTKFAHPLSLSTGFPTLCGSTPRDYVPGFASMAVATRLPRVDEDQPCAPCTIGHPTRNHSLPVLGPSPSRSMPDVRYAYASNW